MDEQTTNLNRMMPSTKCHLTSLSLDVFALIAIYLDTHDIQSARLAGRELHWLLSSYLFRTITFTPHRDRLDILDAIQKNNVLSHNTSTLRFDTSICRLQDVEDEIDELDYLM
jgi:hypothetical protein